LPDDEQEPILALLGRVADHGPTINPRKFKPLHGEARELLELKSSRHRILCFYGRNRADGRPTIIMTNAFPKKKDRTPPSEIQKALDGQSRYEAGRS
jgi:hypothetical protein